MHTGSVLGGGGRTATTPVPSTRLRDDRGSQALELAMATPIAVGILAAILAIGLVMADLALASTLAREVARTAAVGEDARIDEVVAATVGERIGAVEVDPPPGQRAVGDLVTAHVTLAPMTLGPITGPAMGGRAVMRAEVE